MVITYSVYCFTLLLRIERSQEKNSVHVAKVDWGGWLPHLVWCLPRCVRVCGEPFFGKPE